MTSLLLRHLVALGALVSGLALHVALPVSQEQLEELSVGVCDDLVFDAAEASLCRKEFFRPSKHIGYPSRAQLKCQKKRTLTFMVEAADDYQLLVLVPDNYTETYLDYTLISPNETLSTIYLTTGQDDLQVWMTKLTERGSPGSWVLGDRVPNWGDVITQYRPYEIELVNDFVPMDGDIRHVYGVFRWNSSDPSDQCFDVRNHCDHANLGNFLQKKIRPGDPHSQVVDGLNLNDNCSFIVEGKYGRSTFNYSTPSCHTGGAHCVAEIPQNITISSTRADIGWDVSVSWQRPRHAPLYYNVTLRAARTRHVRVAGNDTEVTISDVVGERVFHVDMVAVTTLDKAYASRLALFPEEESSSIGVIVAGAWCLVLVVGVGVVGAALWLQRRRRAALRHLYFPDLEDKESKSGSGETFSTDSSISTDPWEISPDRLVLHEVLGEGAFGVVRRGSLAPGGKEVAVKTLKDYPSVEEVRSFRAEMELMKSVGAHPHVVSLAGCCSGRRPMIVAEYCSRGDLLHYLRCAWDVMVSKRNAKYYNNNIEYGADYRNDIFKSKKEHSRLVINKLYDLQKVCDTELTAIDLLSFCRQIAMGMEFLASNRVVHRDLAARNVLVCADKTLKIADFGLSRDVYQENQYKQKGTGKLPIKWMALESLTHRIYTTQSDVWSFGVVVWEVVSMGGSPYPGVAAGRLPRLLRAGYRMPRPSNCSKQLNEVMQSCWRARPRERPTFAELHQQLDALLNSACADQYITLELEEELPQIPKYRSLLPRSMCNWSKRSDVNTRPLKALQSNHYTSSPDSINRTQLV